MAKETRYLSKDLKNTIFKNNRTILELIYYIGNRIMFKEQIKILMAIIEPLNKSVDQSLEELINYGFLKEQQILTSKKYALYLTSYPIACIEGVPSRNVSCVNPSVEKVLNSLLRVEYFLELIKKENVFYTFPDPIAWVQLLQNNGNTLFADKSNALELYTAIEKNEDINFIKDFLIDKDVCCLEKAIDFNNKSKYKINLNKNEIESLEQLNRAKLSFTKNNRFEEKYFFNCKMFLGRNFVLENIKQTDEYTIKVNIACVDYANSLGVEKLFNNIGFIFNMFDRYLTSKIEEKIDLEVTVFAWDKINKIKLENNEKEKVKILGSSEYKKYPKGLNALINSGVTENKLKDIKVKYKTLDIKDKYGITK